LDGIQAPAELSAEAALVWAWLANAVPRVGSALIVALVGYFAARWIGRVLSHLAVNAVGVDPTIAAPLSVVVRYVLLFFVVIATLGQLGIQTTSVVAAVGAIGLGIGLALQGTLSNIAAGLMLLWLRPFRAGDYIENPIASGTVREIGLFATELLTFEGIYRFVPNSALWNTPLVNYTRNATRLFNVTFGIKLEDDAAKALRLLAEAARARLGGSEPAPEVFIDGAADAFTYIIVRAWLPSRRFWPAHRELVAALRTQLADGGIAVQRITHATPDVGDQGVASTAARPGLLHWWRPGRDAAAPPEGGPRRP
jgi:small conductance mechanosensitive channel